MSKGIVVARVLLGLIFAIFGANGFLNFLPQPEVPEAAGAFLGALAASGYLFPVLKTVEILAGIGLLLGRWVPLSLTLLAPILVNIVLFHLFLALGGLPIAFLVLALEIFLAWAYRSSFKGVLNGTAQPG